MTRQRFMVPVTATLALAAAIAVAGPAPAWGPGPPPDGGFQRQLDKLNLDPGQREDIQKILDAAKPQREQMHTQLENARERMHELMQQDQPNEEQIMAQADTMGQLQIEAHKAMLHTLLQVRAELTPAQRTQLEDLMPRGRGPRHHRGDGGNS